MKTDDAEFFKLVHGYTRKHHRCFLSEMTLDSAGNLYSLCF